jgi:urea transport system substrate-binding protein
MMIDEQNKKGGLLGRKLEAVVVDPASDWPLFAEKGAELLEKDKVVVVFGCWTSVSRNRCCQCSRRTTACCSTQVQYEGEESSKNVIYTGAAPNQQAIPAVDYLMKDTGREALGARGNRLRLPADDEQDPRGLPQAKGVAAADISINYTPFGHSDWQSRVATIKRFGSAGKEDRGRPRRSTATPTSPFYKELGNQKVSAEDIPVVAFSVGEEELSGLDAKPLVGHLAAWNYFQSISAPANKEIISKWKTFIRTPKRTTNDPMEAHYIGFNLWAQAVTKAKSTEVEKVLAALPGLSTPN